MNYTLLFGLTIAISGSTQIINSSGTAQQNTSQINVNRKITTATNSAVVAMSLDQYNSKEEKNKQDSNFNWHIKYEFKHDFQNNEDQVSCIAYSPSGDRLVVSGFKGFKIYYLNNDLKKAIETYQEKAENCYKCMFLPNGQLLCTENNKIKLWYENNKYVNVCENVKNTISSLAISSKFFAFGTNKGEIYIADQQNRIYSTGLGDFRTIWALAFSSDQKYLLCLNSDKITKWNINNGLAITNMIPNRIPLTSDLALSPDNKIFAAADGGGNIKIYDMNNHECIKTFEASGAPTVGDMTEKGWINTYRALGTIRSSGGHRGPITSLKFSHDSKYLASCGFDFTVKIWSIDLGQCIKTFDFLPENNNETHSPSTIAFSPNSYDLAIGLGSGEIIIVEKRDH